MLRAGWFNPLKWCMNWQGMRHRCPTRGEGVEQVLNPMTVSVIFVLAVIVLCLAKPDGGRLFLGFFYLATAIGINMVTVLTNPQSYVEMDKDSLIPLNIGNCLRESWC